MEHTKRDQVNGTQAAAQTSNAFTVRDPATGKMRGIRDMTDEDLMKHAAAATVELQQHQQQVMQSLMNVANITGALTVFQYEVHRRAVSIVVVQSIPV